MRKIISFTLLLWMLLVPVWAEETEPEPTAAAAEAIQIHTPQDLSAMTQEPNGGLAFFNRKSIYILYGR